MKQTAIAEIPADSDAHRIASVDALRGLALLGILLVNIQVFASAGYGEVVVDPNFHSSWDTAVRSFIKVFFEAKFYLLFSFLFGYSFTLQAAAAEREHEDFSSRMVRRHICLVMLGVAHAVFLFHGDILVFYGTLGLLLLPLRRRSDFTLIVLAIGIIGCTGLMWAVLAVLIGPKLELNLKIEATLLRDAAQALLNYRATPGTVVEQHIADWHLISGGAGLGYVPCILAMLLWGMVLGRRQVLRHFEDNHALFQRVFYIGLIVGVPGAVFYAAATASMSYVSHMAGFAACLATAPFLTAAYISAAMYAFHGRAGATLVGVFAPAGRMALSNYLLQSVVCSLIFHAYGLRLIGTVSPGATVALAVVIFAAQLMLSRIWMRSHAYGPVEWLLRMVTLARVPAWHRS